jgi:hypothetical protein
MTPIKQVINMNRQYQTNHEMRTARPEKNARNVLFSIFQLSLALLFFSACEQETGSETTDEKIPVTFSALIDAAPQTRTTANGDQWTGSDSVGIFMLNTTATLPGGIVGDGDNVRYTVAADGTMSAASNGLYYPQSGNVDFIIYYPYRTTLSNYTFPVDVKNQGTLDSLSSIDLLYAKIVDVGKSRNSVQALFYHKLSKFTLNMRPGRGKTVADFANMTVRISGMPVTATFALADGSLAADAVPADSDFAPRTVNDSCYEAILIPQLSNTYSDRKITFTLANEPDAPYVWNIPNPSTFLEGRHHIYTVTVNTAGISVSDSIAPWDAGSNPTEDNAVPVTYIVGDYYPDPGVIYDTITHQVVSGIAATGVVFWVDSTKTPVGIHGKVAGLNSDITPLPWGPGSTNTYATDPANGAANLDSIKKQSNWATDYPAFKWCADRGARWYLPAVNELQHLYCAYNGVAPVTWPSGTPPSISTPDANVQAAFNAKLTVAGGTELKAAGLSDLWSSTEETGDNAKYVDFADGNTLSSDKTNIKNVRAIRAF